MTGRALADRLERLETRQKPGRKLPSFVLRFVSPGGTVVSTLTLHEGGRREWWHASGRRPEDVPQDTPGDLRGGLK